MGAELRDHRRPPPGLARVQADVQRTVDAGEVRLSESSPSATRFRRAGRGRVEVITFKPLSKNPGALHNGLRAADERVYVIDKGAGMLRLDDNPGGQDMSRTEYEDAVADADVQYAQMLRALLDSVR